MSGAEKQACTLGPWSVEGPDYFGDWNIHHPANRLAVGAVVSNLRPAEEVAANAHILGAAWDMHEALAGLVREIEAYCDLDGDDPGAAELRAAKAALAKARGGK